MHSDRHEMDRFDRELVEFWLSWQPYGGPPADEVLPEFGMSRNQLHSRVIAVVRTNLNRRLGIDERILLMRAGLASGIISASTSQSPRPRS
jgi:hypothetical protein